MDEVQDVVQKEKENNTVTLQIEVKSEKVNEALEKAYQKVVQEVSISGFRKGKVPRPVLEAKYGEEVLYKDALDILIPEAYEAAIEKTGLEPISEPEISDYEIKKGEPLIFEAKVDLKPEIELEQYTDIEAVREKVEINEEEIDEYLKEKQEEHAQLENSDKQFVEEEDYVIIDFDGKIDGESFPGGSEEEYGLEIGSKDFIPGFEEKLIGHKVAEEFEIEVTFPEDYQAPDLAGKTATFNVEIKEIKEKVKPEIDDELAKQATEYETIEEYKEEIRNRIREEREERVDNQFLRKIMDTISEDIDEDIPEEMIEKELNLMYYNTASQFAGQDISFEEILKQSGMDREMWNQQNYQQALTRVKDKLILEAVIREEKFEISEEELEEEINNLAEQFSQEPKELREKLEERNQITMVKKDLKREKAANFLKENNIGIEKTAAEIEKENKSKSESKIIQPGNKGERIDSEEILEESEDESEIDIVNSNIDLNKKNEKE